MVAPPTRPRRRLSDAYKLAVLAEYDAAAPGVKGSILRRERIYSSYVARWRRSRDRDFGASIRQAELNPDVGQPGLDYLTSGDAARCLYVTARTILRWADTGYLSSVRTAGGQRRFHRDDIEAAVALMYAKQRVAS